MGGFLLVIGRGSGRKYESEYSEGIRRGIRRIYPRTEMCIGLNGER